MNRLHDAMLTEFARYLHREEKSLSTREKYLRDVKVFLRYLSGHEITKESVIHWKHKLIESGYAVNSVNSMLASVNCLLGYMGLQNCRVKNIRTQRQTYCSEEQELTKEDYKKLLQAAEKDIQTKLLLQTICATGIRVSELRYFTVEAVHRGQITVSCKSKSRIVWIPEKLRKQLLRYASQKSIAAGEIFTGKRGGKLDRSYIWRKMKKLGILAGVSIGKVFPHNLRKLFARTFYSAEKDIAKLADILGHSSINTTRIYIVTTGEEHRRRIDRLGLVI